MKRRFNTTGACSAQRHYMVKLDRRLKKIKEDYVDDGSYFVINRGRQYGKTTTLNALEEYLKDDYLVLSLDFQQFGTEDFADASTFARAFAEVLIEALEISGVEDKDALLSPLREFAEKKDNGLKDLFVCLSSICISSLNPVVLMIDEVDSASNNQVFVDFLAQLRASYLRRDKIPAFHSVILVGVYSIKNLKLKLRPESEHQYNSPWNIAADFDVDMSFSPTQISEMLEEYEWDYHTGMDTGVLAEEIYAYTSGYPVLVSLICKRIDEKIAGSDGYETLGKAWTKKGVEKAVSLILKEGSLLFESMVKQLDTYTDLHDVIEDIIYRGKKITYSPEHRSINLGVMFGFLKEENGHVAIANRMFEMCLLNLFMAEEAGSDAYSQGGSDRIAFVQNNRLDMTLVLKKFVDYFTEICSEKDTRFIEKYGRKIFLLYLKPIINGTGNYYLESQTRDERRTDVIVDYLGEQFIVELKIWHGNEYNERGERQLLDYLEFYHKDKGYMLSFNFNQNKKTGVREIKAGGRTIVEAVV
ncbi:MAG: AAA-like domain-containing protein [Lachnospiraceae bacterium]|nr:AAA-like domain-containing protein [Lachnospiraceae bacterium]